MSWSDAIALIAAAVGAFFGSGLAFLIEENRRKRTEKDSRYSALIQTQFAIGMQLNTLVIIQRRHLDRYREQTDRHMRITPVEMSTTDIRTDVGSIGFIAEVDDVEILHRIYVAEQSYLTAIGALLTTNQSIQEIRYKGAISHGPINPETGEATAYFDKAQVFILKQIIDGLYESVDSAIISQGNILNDLRILIKRLYPKRKALEFKIPEPEVTG